MFNLLFRLCLTFNSISIFGIVYAVKTHLWIHGMGIYTMLIYILFLILFSLLCLKLTNYLGKDSIEKVDNIEIGAESYMAVYLGYFFVATGLPDNDRIVFLFVFILLFLFTFFSQTQYFNPMFLLLGYKFYGLTREDGVKIFIISKRKIYSTAGVSFMDLRRINDFTYIDKEK